MSLRVELDFSSFPVSGDTFDELETWTPESPVEEISMIKSALSGVSTKVNRPQPSKVDLITSSGILLPCVLVIKTFLAAANLIDGVSMRGFFSGDCCALLRDPVAITSRAAALKNVSHFMVPIGASEHRM
jgi:hypothetical protein